MDWKALFLSPNGRIGRRDFWIGFLIIFVASIVTNVIPVIGHLLGLLLLWPQVCIHAKRLHDASRSAWLMLIPFGVFIVCLVLALVTGGAAVVSAIMMGNSGQDAAATAAAMSGAAAVGGFFALAVLVGFAFLLWVGLSKGTDGPNTYGPPPAKAA